MAIKVLLADDSELVRSAIRRLLSNHPQITLLGEVSDFAQTIQMIDQLRPDLVLLDLHMANNRQISPPEFKSRISSGSTRVLAISVWSDGESQALAESFGAAKLLEKVNLGKDLIPAILQLASSSSDPAIT